MPVPRALRAILPALLLIALAPAAASAAPTATFEKRFSANDSGNIAIVGNTLMSCPAPADPSNTACATAKRTTASVAGVADNDFDMAYVDTDDDASTFDSSSAKLDLPTGGTVLFAGLYWGARTNAGTNGADARNAAAKNTVKLRAPHGEYATVTAEGAAKVVDTTAYQHFADVTAAVKAAGSGVYGVADVQAGTGQDRYAGWSLVVAYQDLNAAPRNLSVFDGLTVVSQSSTTVDINVSGFTTAPSGTVKTTLGAIAYEGDLGKTGDGMKLQGTPISDTANPATDLFNSSVSVLGARTMAGRNPAQENHLGFDADLFAADGILPNRAGAATLTVNTAASGGETIYPGVVTFASELLAAKLRPVTTVRDLNDGNPEPGDILEYEVAADNTGNGTATELQLDSEIPAGVELVEDSLEVVEDETPGGARTAQGGDDGVTYDPSTRTVRWNVGSGATPTTGGSLPKGHSVRIRYRVRVGAPADGATLPAATTVTYGTLDTSDHYTVPATGGTLSASSPDLALDLSRTGELVRGQDATYTIAVRNTGSAPARDLVRVTDQLPASLVADGVPSGDGWDCSVADGLVTCDRTDPLAAAASYPSIHVPVRVAQDASGAIVDAATVSNEGDGSHGNDSDSDDGGLAAVRASLALELSTDPATLSPGETATVTATVRNAGPSDAAGVQVALPLPSGLELVSARTGDQDCVATTCPVGTVASGHAGTAVYVVRALRGAADGTQQLTATSTSAVADATAGDDTASASIAVRALRLVSVSQSVAPDALIAGAPVTLGLEVRNDGPTTATGVVLEEPLPAQLRGVDVDIDAADGTCAIVSGALRCELAPLADGDRVPVTVRATIASDAAGAALDLDAALAPVDADPDRSDDTASVHRTVAGRADLSLTAIGAPDTVRAGEKGTWVFRAVNDGPGDATGTTFTVPLPAGMRLADAAGATCASVGGVLTCSLGRLVAGAEREISLTLAVDPAAAAGPRDLTAVLGADEPDPDSADARADVTTTVRREADLGVTQAGPADVVAGLAATYTATVTNAGPSSATDVAVAEPVPAGLTGASAAVRDGRGACAVANGTIACRIAGLAVGERAVVDLTGTVARDAGGRSIDAIARVRADEADADPRDNEASRRSAAAAVSDVSVSAFAPVGIVQTGKQAEVTLNVRNDGPSTADGVVLTTMLPAAAQPVDLDPRCSVAGRTVTCRLGSIEVGQDRPVLIRVRALHPFDGSTLGSGAGVSTSGRDPQPANDSLALKNEQPVRCTSRRKFTIRLRVPAAATLRSVSVTVAGRKVRVRRGGRLTATVDLRKRPAGRILVRIRAVTRSGQQVVGTRAYQTCHVKRPTVKPPRV